MYLHDKTVNGKVEKFLENAEKVLRKPVIMAAYTVACVFLFTMYGMTQTPTSQNQVEVNPNVFTK